MQSLKLIEAFYWVARLRSFRAAAERMHVTQPGVTYRVKELERQLGRPLLIRGGQPVRLTPQGQSLFAHAEKLLTLMQDMQQHLRPGTPLTGILRLGVMDAFAAVCLPDLLRDLTESHPGLDVSVAVDLSHTLTLKLEAGEVDIAVVSTPPRLPGLRYERLGEQRAGWVAAPALRARLTDAAGLAQQRIFATPPPSNLVTLTGDWFRAEGLETPSLSLCNSMSAIVGLVGAGAGIGIMPLKLVEDAIAAGRLCHLDFVAPIRPQEIFIALPIGMVDPALPVAIEAIRTVVAAHAFDS